MQAKNNRKRTNKRGANPRGFYEQLTRNNETGGNKLVYHSLPKHGTFTSDTVVGRAELDAQGNGGVVKLDL
jgi:hypothetical protein